MRILRSKLNVTQFYQLFASYLKRQSSQRRHIHFDQFQLWILPLNLVIQNSCQFAETFSQLFPHRWRGGGRVTRMVVVAPNARYDRVSPRRGHWRGWRSRHAWRVAGVVGSANQHSSFPLWRFGLADPYRWAGGARVIKLGKGVPFHHQVQFQGTGWIQVHLY